MDGRDVLEANAGEHSYAGEVGVNGVTEFVNLLPQLVPNSLMLVLTSRI